MMEKKKPAAAATATGKRLNRAGNRPPILYILAGLLLIVTLVSEFWKQETVWVQQSVTVHAGQTLWEIAESIKADGDVRTIDEILYEIKQDNPLNNFIHPGDRLIVWTEVLKNEAAGK